MSDVEDIRNRDDFTEDKQLEILREHARRLDEAGVENKVVDVPGNTGLGTPGEAKPFPLTVEDIEKGRVISKIYKPVLEAIVEDDGDAEDAAEVLREEWPDEDVDEEIAMQILPAGLVVDKDAFRDALSK